MIFWLPLGPPGVPGPKIVKIIFIYFYGIREAGIQNTGISSETTIPGISSETTETYSVVRAGSGTLVTTTYGLGGDCLWGTLVGGPSGGHVWGP